jgi:hypothetical protein
MSTDPALNAAATPTVTVTAAPPAAVKAFNQDDGPSFSDVLDILNPLQHIPIINTIYQHLTGDSEGAVADVAGGTLWTGPIGLVGSLVDLAVKSDTGKSISDNILSWLGLEDDDKAAVTAQAEAQQQQAAQAQAVTNSPPAVTVQALAALPPRQRPEERKDAERKSDKDGPVQMGDYLVFGAAGSAQPLALTPAQPVMAANAPAGAADQQSGGPRQQGQYLVFGGSAAPQKDPAGQQQPRQTAATPSLPSRPVDYLVFGATPSAPTARMTPVSATVTEASPLPPVAANVNAEATSAPSGGGPAPLSPLPAGRSFAAPARRVQVTPNALPMPTTGPAAIPGHSPSQAIPATSTASTDDSWFAQAVNAGLDKYAAAQRLTGQDNLTAGAVTGAQSASLH